MTRLRTINWNTSVLALCVVRLGCACTMEYTETFELMAYVVVLHTKIATFDVFQCFVNIVQCSVFSVYRLGVYEIFALFVFADFI